MVGGCHGHARSSLVGAPNHDGAFASSGIAYLYERTAGGWRLELELRSPTPGQSHHFGREVALSDRLAALGVYEDSQLHNDDRRKTPAWLARSTSPWTSSARIRCKCSLVRPGTSRPGSVTPTPARRRTRAARSRSSSADAATEHSRTCTFGVSCVEPSTGCSQGVEGWPRLCGFAALGSRFGAPGNRR